MTAQQSPFLFRVPIQHSKALPGIAVHRVNWLLDGLGNPAGTAIRKALDDTGVIHFLSLTVVWDKADPDPPLLIGHVAADGTVESVISALVKQAGPLLLPVFKVAAGVKDVAGLKQLLMKSWVQHVGSPAPPGRHRVTGLPFQGTPGLTVAQILEDDLLVQKTRAAVAGHNPSGGSTAMSSLNAARTQAGLKTPSGPRFAYSDEAPGLSRANFLSKASVFAGLIVSEWLGLLVILLVFLFLNIADLFSPMLSPESGNSSRFFYLVFVAITFAIIAQRIGTKTASKDDVYLDPIGFLRRRFAGLGVAVIAAIGVSVWLRTRQGTTLLAKGLRVLHLSPHFPPAWFRPFGWWEAFVLGVLTLVLFLATVAGVLLAILRAKEESNRPYDEDPDPALLSELMRREDQAPYKQNHMIAVSTLSSGFFRPFVFLPLGLYVAGLTVRSGMFREGFLAGLDEIHFLQWSRISRRKLLFSADYDGSWQSYLEDAVTQLPSGASGIWSNAKGFPKTNWLFTQGATDGDRFKRWVRRQMVPPLFWYSAYPHLTSKDIRLNRAVRQGLEAETITASEAATWLNLLGAAPRPVSDLETEQIQGLALSPYRHLVEGAFLAITFSKDPASCGDWLREIGQSIHFGEEDPGQRAMAVAISARGLERLERGAPGSLAARFSPAFAMGMTDPARTNALGDFGASAPDAWSWGNEHKPVDAVLLLYAQDKPALAEMLAEEKARCARFHFPAPYDVRLRAWPHLRDLDTGQRVPITEPFGFVDGISQPSIKGLLSSRGAGPRDLLEPGEFILGYPDNRGTFPPTPQVFDDNDPRRLLPDLPDRFPPPPTDEPRRDLGRNGTYLVIRQLQQNKTAYQAFLQIEAARLGKTTEWVAAKMVGRWPNGAPLVLYPDGPPPSYDVFETREDFLFGRDDPQGLACPFGAHIRRANPRDQFEPDDPEQISITNRHRIIRRGRSYVSGTSSDAEADGLMFMCINADIERQFEFLQQTWIGSTSFTHAPTEADPITGLRPQPGTYTIQQLGVPMQLQEMPTFVNVVGGGYFFLPGRSALEFLAAKAEVRPGRTEMDWPSRRARLAASGRRRA